MAKSDMIILIHDVPQSEGGSVGLNYIHAYVQPHHDAIESAFTDFPISEDFIEKTISQFNPQIIGLQILTATRGSAFAAIEKIHTYAPHIQIIIGGIHVTVMHKQILRKYPFVIAILGEGEETTQELTQAILNKSALNTITGIAFSTQGEIITTPARPLIASLDKLPFPKHAQIVHSPQNKMARILTSRGCPFNCSFCCTTTITKNYVRFRSIENVIAELIYIKESLPHIEYINIADSTFLLDNSRVIQFCNEVITRNLQFKFIASGRAHPLSPEMVAKLSAAGFITIGLGLESANDEVREKNHKEITKEQVLRAVQLFAKTKINIQIFAIVGLPGETWQTIRETGLFIQKLQKIKYIYYWHGFFQTAKVYPGTELYEKMLTAGACSAEYWLTTTTLPLYTTEHAAETIEKMYQELNTYVSLDYFFSRKGLLRQLPIVLGSKDRITLLGFLFKIFLKGKHPHLVARIQKYIPSWISALIKKYKLFGPPPPLAA